MKVKLQNIFTSHPGRGGYTKKELRALALEEGFVREMAARLNLTFQESNSSENNLCFANSVDVRPEFRTFYTKTDIVHYVCACLDKDLYELAPDEVPFPASTTTFWEGVALGQ